MKAWHWWSLVVAGALVAGCYLMAKYEPQIAGAFFTGTASVAGLVLLVFTIQLWLEAAHQRRDLARQNEAQLMLTLMVEYDDLRGSIRYIRDYFLECAGSGPTDPLKRFDEEMSVGVLNVRDERMEELDDHRFRVSRFFVKIRKLVEGRYFTDDVVIRALGHAAIEDVFLKLVDPLDSTTRTYGAADKRFYSDLLEKYPRTTRNRAVRPTSRS
jgi:hypothetical protein